MKLDRAIDRYLGELARRGYSPRTRMDYRRKLVLLCGPSELVEVRDVDVEAGTIRFREKGGKIIE